MPKGRAPSWAMKTAIWDLASKLGARPEVMLRDLEKLCRHDMPLEGEFPPDPRTVTNTINELQTLRIKVLATLPPYVWEMRKDYKEIRPELERLVQAGGNIVPSVFEENLSTHTESVLNLLDTYARQLKVSYEPEGFVILPKEGALSDKDVAFFSYVKEIFPDQSPVFAPLLKIEPSFAALEGHYEGTRLWEDIKNYKQANDVYVGTGLKLHKIIMTKIYPFSLQAPDEVKVFLEGLMELMRVELAPLRVRLYMEGIETDLGTVLERLPDQGGKPLQQYLDFVNKYKSKLKDQSKNDMHEAQEEGKVILELTDSLEKDYEIMKRLEKAIIRGMEEEKLRGMLPTGTKCKFCPPANCSPFDELLG